MTYWNPVWYQAMTSSFSMTMMAGKKKTVVFLIKAPFSGVKIRLHFSNRYGRQPYEIGSLILCLKRKIVPVTVNGSSCFSIPTGKDTVSDEIPLTISIGDEIEVRLFYKTKVYDGNMIEEEAKVFPEDVTLYDPLPIYTAPAYKAQYSVFDCVPGLRSVEVLSEQPSQIIAAFGDSITAMSRWTKPLQSRLSVAYGQEFILLNAGISGNCLLYDVPGFMSLSCGRKGIDRFEDDVLSQQNLHTVILALGVNDIAYYTSKTKKVINLGNYQKAVIKMVEILRSQKVRVVAQTLSPRKGYPRIKYTEEMEALRQQINSWLRSCGLFDWVLDADAVLRDPAHPDMFKEGLHQGDFTHPNQVGGQKLADAYDLHKLTGK